MSTEPTTEIKPEDIQFGEVQKRADEAGRVLGEDMDDRIRGTPQQATVVKKEEERGVGRPTVMTRETLDKLEVGFTYSYTDAEACLYAGISVDALYKYQRENPAYIKRKEELRLTPNLMAKKVLVEGIKDDTGQARWWAERKIRNDFQPSAKVEHSGNVVMTGTENPMIDKEEAEIAKRYEDELERVESRYRTPEEIAGGTKVEALPEVTKTENEHLSA